MDLGFGGGGNNSLFGDDSNSGFGTSTSEKQTQTNTDSSATTADQGSVALDGENSGSITVEDGSQEAMDLANDVVAENIAAAEGLQDTAVDSIEEMGLLSDTAIGEQASTADRAMSLTTGLAGDVVARLERGLGTMADRTESATKGALDWASEATRSDAANTTTTAIQWGAGALAVAAVAWALTR